MTRMLLLIAITAASKATQAAYDTAKAAGCTAAAAQLRHAGELIAGALKLITVAQATTEAS